MTWGDCGKNKLTGDNMGYLHYGVCSQLGCSTQIDHGLSYVCGDMHEGGEHGCGHYYCRNHLIVHHCEFPHCQLCLECTNELESVK